MKLFKAQVTLYVIKYTGMRWQQHGLVRWREKASFVYFVFRFSIESFGTWNGTRRTFQTVETSYAILTDQELRILARAFDLFSFLSPSTSFLKC